MLMPFRIRKIKNKTICDHPSYNHKTKIHDYIVFNGFLYITLTAFEQIISTFLIGFFFILKNDLLFQKFFFYKNIYETRRIASKLLRVELLY